uniref:Large ribosomal subunit protein mL46 n=1 Tax=Caenorhabditis japonica TaxID=281687 RepID=A0A8R1HWA9_CAEJA
MHLSARRFFAQNAPKLDIFASVVLSRAPVIAPPMSEVEQRFQRLQKAEEREKSLLNDYELKTKQDEKMVARREQLAREGKELSELDEQIGVTNAVREDEWKRKAAELDAKYNFSTDSGTLDAKSLQRLLDRQVVLIVKQKLGEKGYTSPWILPQMKHRAGETLRQTAERCIGEISGGDFSASISGNAPFAVFTHKYPAPVAQKTGVPCAKIFFFMADLAQNSEEFSVNPEDVSDYQWVNREEFWKTVPGTDYKKAARYAFLE